MWLCEAARYMLLVSAGRCMFRVAAVDFDWLQLSNMHTHTHVRLQNGCEISLWRFSRQATTSTEDNQAKRVRTKTGRMKYCKKCCYCYRWRSGRG